MIAAISPEGYAFIVGGLAFLCTVLAFALAAAANAELMRYRARHSSDQADELPSNVIALDEVERFREELDRERDLVKAIGGGNSRVSADERWAA